MRRAASLLSLFDLREHSSWSAGAASSDYEAALREDHAGRELRQHEGSESHDLRLRSEGDLKPTRPDDELHSVLAR